MHGTDNIHCWVVAKPVPFVRNYVIALNFNMRNQAVSSLFLNIGLATRLSDPMTNVLL